MKQPQAYFATLALTSLVGIRVPGLQPSLSGPGFSPPSLLLVLGIQWRKGPRYSRPQMPGAFVHRITQQHGNTECTLDKNPTESHQVQAPPGPSFSPAAAVCCRLLTRLFLGTALYQLPYMLATCFSCPVTSPLHYPAFPDPAVG